MAYQLGYTRYEKTWAGSLFNSIDDAIDSGCMVMLNYLDGIDNQTEKTFGINIEIYYSDVKLIKPVFCVMEVQPVHVQKIGITHKFIQEIDLSEIATPNYNKSSLTFSDTSDTNEQILSVYNSLGMGVVHAGDHFNNLALNLDRIQYSSSSIFLQDYIVDAYVSLVLLANKLGVDIQIEYIQHSQPISLLEELGDVAVGINGLTDSSNAINKLIHYVKELAEKIFNINLPNALRARITKMKNISSYININSI